MRTLLLLAFTLLLLPASAQSPGYRGKHFMIGYCGNAFLATNFSVGNEAQLRPIFKHEFFIRAAVSRKTTIGFSYHRGRQLLVFRETVLPGSIENIYFEPDKYLNACNLQIFDLHFQFSRRSFIAPVGLYHQVGIGIVRFNLANDSLKGENTNTSSDYAIKRSKDDEPGVRLSYTLGRSNVIKGNLLVNTAIGLNFFVGDHMGLFTPESDDYSLPEKSYLANSMGRSISWTNLIDVKVGLAYLIF